MMYNYFFLDFHFHEQKYKDFLGSFPANKNTCYTHKNTKYKCLYKPIHSYPYDRTHIRLEGQNLNEENQQTAVCEWRVKIFYKLFFSGNKYENE